MKLSRLARFIIGIATALALSIALVMAVMRPPWADMWQLALSFLISGGASAIFGFIAHRMGWWRRVSRIRYTITLGYVLAAGLTLLNVWLTASLMFINEHDLTLAGLLLLFSSGVSISFGYFLSSSITQTLSDIVQAARKVGEGDFSARVVVTGKDETAQLAQAFNAMTERLAQAEADSRALDAARRDLVAWASHDLRTPLTSLRAMLDALTDGVVSDPETVARYLQQSRSEVSRMNLIINDLFELSQLDTGHIVLKLEQASVADIISDTLQGFSLSAKNKGIELTGSVAPRLDVACIAPEKISRVLQNLVENALRYTPAGGSVTLRAEQTENAMVVSVCDTGEGIPPADLPRVFERFYRGERSRAREAPGSQPGGLNAGAGLGLAIAKGLVEAHQGRIWAESEPGKGTTVSFSLPTYGS
jgi:signal transduction histidine kinase